MGQTKQSKEETRKPPQKDEVKKKGIRIPKICPDLMKLRCRRSKEIEKNYSPKNIFLNVPYTKEYKAQFLPLIWLTLKYFKYKPILASDSFDFKKRICHIHYGILISGSAISDFSDPTLDNMPFEFGLMCSAGVHSLQLSHDPFELLKRFSNSRDYPDSRTYENEYDLISILYQYYRPRLKKNVTIGKLYNFLIEKARLLASEALVGKTYNFSIKLFEEKWETFYTDIEKFGGLLEVGQRLVIQLEKPEPQKDSETKNK